MTARTSLRLLAGLGAVASAALLAACGDDGTTSTGSTSSNGSTTSSAGGGTTTGSGGAGGGAATNGTGGGGGVDPFAGPVKSLTEVDLGSGDLGQYVFFQIPDRTVGFTVLGETTDAGPFGLNRLRAPSTTSVISGYAIPGTGLTAFVDENVISAQDPQSDLPDAWPVAEGKWLIALGGDGPTTGHARLFVRRTEDGVFHGGAVDINVFLSPGSGAGQSYVNAMLSKLFGNYYTPKIGLSLGNVAYFTVPSSYDDVSTYAEYRTLLSSSAGIGTAPALNLFVIGSMSGELDGALGVAGGIPGSPMVHGTPRSGVAYTPTGNGDYDASVLAHEVGHLAGLFHTSEFQISAFDPLGDTPECPNIMNTNPSNCPDVSNVMFPIAYGGNVMTAWQARVMQGSALYRGALTEGGAFSEPLPTPLLPNAAQPSSGVETSFELGEVAVRAPTSPIEAALTGHWCARSPGIASALAAELDDSTTATVASLALDPGAFDVTRAHALELLARAASEGRAGVTETDVIDTADAMLADTKLGRQATLAALGALGALAPARATERARMRLDHVDPVIRTLAVELSP